LFQSDLTQQPQLFAFSPRDLVPKGSDVWLYMDLFDSLNTEEFEWDYVASGQQAKDPKLMLRTIFYGLTHGVNSGRALASACTTDVRFIVLSGERMPDARTFHRFIRRHEERMPELFTQVVQLAMKMGLAKLGRIAIDGSRLKANTSKHKAMSYGRMKKTVDQLNEELQAMKRELESLSEEDQSASELPDEIKRREDRLAKIKSAKDALEKEKGEALKDSDQKSFNDHDALPMAGKGEGFKYGYNAQAAVDEDNQIIVGCKLHDNQCDSGSVASTLEEVAKNCGDNPSEVLVDSAYSNAKDLGAIEAVGARPYAATGKGESSEITVDDQLIAEEDSHEYSCMAGKLLPTRARQSNGKTVIQQLPKSFCRGCPFKAECKLTKKKSRYTIRPRNEWNTVQANRERMRSGGNGVFKRRKAIVEPVFGNIKTKGIKINIEGNSKVSTWWTMVCMALNLEKIVGHLASVEVLALNFLSKMTLSKICLKNTMLKFISDLRQIFDKVILLRTRPYRSCQVACQGFYLRCAPAS